MQTVSLILPDEHPLVQLGFRGRFRLGIGVDVEIAGVSRRPRIRRRLPPRKRRALVLMAFGFGPAELAGRLGMCLEQAEALHEELTRKLGLDRIAGQVRSAIREGLVDREATVLIPFKENRSEVTMSPSTQRSVMADEELVRIFFPEAMARLRGDGSWVIVTEPDPRSHRLGEGKTEDEAWTSAAIRLWKDEWFRPIIVQLQTMRSEEPGRA